MKMKKMDENPKKSKIKNKKLEIFEKEFFLF
jgi:hypothetical protein